MALVLKTSEVKASVGSNPTTSVGVTRQADSLKGGSITGRSAAVARLFWEQKVAGSIPAAPILLIGDLNDFANGYLHKR